MSKKTPQIRFKGFTDDWEERKLKDVTERVRSNDGRMDLPTLTMSASSGWLDQKDRFSGDISGKEKKNYTLLKKGELSYNHGNSKLAKYGVVFSLTNYEEALVPRVYHSFKALENTSADFIEYMFSTKLPDRELGKLISSGARMDGLLNINYDDFMNIHISIPNYEEQILMSAFFRKLDENIALHQRKLDLLKEQKKGFLQKMFPKNGSRVPELRFEGFSDDWEERKLGDEVRIVMGQSPNSENYTDDPNDYILVQGNADMKNGRVFPRVWTTQVTKQAEKDDLILSVRAPVGDIGKTAYDVVIGRGVAAIKGNEFIFQNLGKMKSDGYWTRYSTGSTFESINSTDIKEAIISVPEIEEQNKIGSLFKQLDNTIALHQRKLDLLKEQKKGFLQKMFVS
ncbi:restriction endonuclease subunit S [Leuconostoc mesenteroides]|uniref:restriction endonuclease subunit S n=1 Tax=Leuconostoc mesenteroides TaxID=1245 RepID=UPI00235E1E42|nr:restriction endonuclease subunit S [Leuconostoc mesenteroides]